MRLHGQGGLCGCRLLWWLLSSGTFRTEPFALRRRDDADARIMEPFASTIRIIAGDHVAVAHLIAEAVTTFIDRLARKRIAEHGISIETAVRLVVEQIGRGSLVLQRKILVRRRRRRRRVRVRLQIRC